MRALSGASIFYFSPEAAHCAPKTLKDFRSSAAVSVQKPDLAVFRKIVL